MKLAPAAALLVDLVGLWTRVWAKKQLGFCLEFRANIVKDVLNTLQLLDTKNRLGSFLNAGQSTIVLLFGGREDVTGSSISGATPQKHRLLKEVGGGQATSYKMKEKKSGRSLEPTTFRPGST